LISWYQFALKLLDFIGINTDRHCFNLKGGALEVRRY